MAFFNDAVRDAKIFIHSFSYNCPSVVVVFSLTLKFKILEDTLAIFLDSLNVSKEGIALGLEDVSCELTCWGNGSCGRVESIEHRNAVRFAEGLEPHLIDQSLLLSV